AQVAGTISAIHVRMGDEVQLGQVLAEIDSAPVRERLLEAENRLRLANTALAHVRTEQQRLHKRRMGLLRQRAQVLEQSLGSQESSIARRQEKMRSFDGLTAEGHLPRLERDEVRDEFEQSRRDGLVLHQELVDTLHQAASLEYDHEESLW